MGISGKFRKAATHTVAGGEGAPNRADSGPGRLAGLPVRSRRSEGGPLASPRLELPGGAAPPAPGS
jgi:hypothetical protein